MRAGVQEQAGKNFSELTCMIGKENGGTPSQPSRHPQLGRFSYIGFSAITATRMCRFGATSSLSLDTKGNRCHLLSVVVTIVHAEIVRTRLRGRRER